MSIGVTSPSKLQEGLLWAGGRLGLWIRGCQTLVLPELLPSECKIQNSVCFKLQNGTLYSVVCRRVKKKHY